MEKGEQQGMKTFDSALFDLFKSGKISYEEALKNADSKNNLRLRIQLSEGKGADETDIDDEEDSGGLSLVQADDDQNNVF
jgi:twitching motility protein PilU